MNYQRGSYKNCTFFTLKKVSVDLFINNMVDWKRDNPENKKSKGEHYYLRIGSLSFIHTEVKAKILPYIDFFSNTDRFNLKRYNAF